jgi:hypothetical protein
MYPIPLEPRPRPPVLPSSLDASLGETGEFILRDVKQGNFPLPEGRPVRQLRVFQVLPKSTTHIANKPRLGHPNAESARMYLGTVPVERDGSAFFRAPAHKPLYFQAVDESGRAVHTMRSLTYLQPGERRGCIGCHERRQSMPTGGGDLLAMKRPPSVIQPGPDGTQPYCYTRLIQPIWDQHCVRCHDGRDKDRSVLTGEPQQEFTRSYNSLRDYVRWYEWGGRSIAGSVTRPGQGGADASPLTKILAGPEHAQQVKLSQAEWQRIYLWLDGNVPFYGVYRKEDQSAQRQGRALPPPVIQ